MELHNAVEEEFKKECVLEPATPAKLAPPRPYCVPNGTGFVRNSSGSSDSGTAISTNDGEESLNLEIKCKDPENLSDNTPLKERDSRVDCELSNGLPSGQITASEQYHIHPNAESLQEVRESGKTVQAKFTKSSIKRQRVQKPIAKRYRPKIHDDCKPPKISKVKLKRNTSDTVDEIQQGKKRKYVKRGLTESPSSNIPVSEIGISPSLQPNTPGPLISEHDHTPEPLADHVSEPVISCRRSLGFSNPQNVALSDGQHENKGEERASFKWDLSCNLPPQDFEDCVELKRIMHQYIQEKEKCNVEENGSVILKKRRLGRKRRVCFDNWSIGIAEINCMKVDKNKKRVNQRTATVRRSGDSSNGPNFSRNCISKDSTIIKEDFSRTPLFELSFVKRKRSSRSFVRNRLSLPLLSPPVEESIKCNVEVQGNFVKCDGVLLISCPENGVPTISGDLAMPDSQTSENDVNTNPQNGPENDVPTISGNLAMPDSQTSENDVDIDSQNGLADASAKPLIDAINQEYETSLVGDKDLQKMVLYQNQNKAIVQYKEKKPQAEVDLDPDILEMWRLLTENGERTPEEVMKSEKLRKLREIFRSRAEAFITTMREFLGNRRFTPWKGSVMDSLIGTFLTQNVSDHLSSSAFMSLRARYPPKHKRKNKDDNKEKAGIDSSVQKCTGAHEQTHVSNSELSDLCETRPPTESVFACKAGPLNQEKLDNLRETLQVEENNFLEQYYDHQSGEVPTDLVERLPFTSSLEEVVDKNSKTLRKLGSKDRKVKEVPQPVDWDQLRKTYSTRSRDSTSTCLDSVDWEAVRQAPVEDIEATIQKRGQQKLLSKRIKDLLERLVKDHGSTDLEWLRDVPPDKAKEFLLSINGLGLKSVECIRLLTLHHKAFPVDTNVARIAVRLGWVPLKPLPKDIQFHVLSQYPPMDEIQKYLWPALCTLDQETLYEFHYQLITFGKVFCPKISPNCSACPKKAECKHKASKDASERLLLPGPQERSTVRNRASITQPLSDSNFQESAYGPFVGEPIVELPSSPELEPDETPSGQTEDSLFSSEDDDMSYINLNNMFDFSRNLLDHSNKIDFAKPLISLPQEESLKLETEFKHLNQPKEFHMKDIEDLPFDSKQEGRDRRMTLDKFRRSFLKHLNETKLSQALVAVSPEKASKPNPKLKNAERLRTEHQVYELPDSHPVLANLNNREPDDPSPYLFAIFRMGESSNSSEKLGQMGKPQAVYLNQPSTFQDQLRQTGKPEEVDLEDQPPTFTNSDIPEEHSEKLGQMGKPQEVYLNQPSTFQDQLRQTGTPQEVDLEDQPPTFTNSDIPKEHSSEKLGQMGKPQEVYLNQPSTFQDQLRQTGKPQEMDLEDQPPSFTNFDIPEEQDHHIVHGTILHPCKTALEGNFPLNGTYFQLNEVFADFNSSQSLIAVPGSSLWNLRRRMLYCGTSATSIIKGSSEEGVKKCFKEGFICVRGFDYDTGAPRHLPDSFHRMILNKNRKPEEWWG